MASLPRVAQSSEALAPLLADVRLVYTDLDGTLLGPGGSIFRDPDGTPTLEPATALIAAQGAGLRIIPVSGRNKSQLLDDVRMLGLCDFIAEAGCLIVHDRLERVWSCVGDFPDGPGSVHDRIVASGADQLLFDAFPGHIEYHTPWTGQRECSLLLRGRVDLAEAGRVLQGTDLPLRLIDNGIIRPKHHTLRGVEEIHAYHLLPEASSKPGAVRTDLGLRGARREQAIAVGDSMSDLEVASEVGLFFLVRNALDDKALANAAAARDNVYVTDGRMGIGWAEVIQALIK